jgi:hypothetical protein
MEKFINQSLDMSSLELIGPAPARQVALLKAAQSALIYNLEV